MASDLALNLFENWSTDWIYTTPTPWGYDTGSADSYLAAVWTHLTTHLSEKTLLVYFTAFWSTFGYVVLYAPFAVIERISFFDRWKCQRKTHTGSEYRDLYTTLILCYLFVIYPAIWLAYPLFQYIGLSMSAEELPSLITFAWQIGVCFLMEDTWHFWIHWLFHKNKFLYNNIHVVHHRWSAPIGLAAQYAHPIEILGLGVGTFAPVVILCPHVVVMWAWISMRQMEAVVVHSGYDFPIAPEYWLPWYAGVDFHDAHHKWNTGNYASTGLFWDYIFGTSARWEQERAAKAEAAKKAGKKA